MSLEFNRNIRDAGLIATFTLPATATSGTSTAFDLGANSNQPSNLEVELSVPALTTTMNTGTNTAGYQYIVEASNSSTFNGISRNLVYESYAGSTTTANGAKVLRCRLPANCERYIRGKVTAGATMGDASTLAATISLRF